MSISNSSCLYTVRCITLQVSCLKKYDKNKINGKGKLFYKGKVKYQGEWKNGEFSGKGVLYFDMKMIFISHILLLFDFEMN